MVGQVLLNSDIEERITNVTITSLPPGTYLVQLKGEQATVVKRMIKL